MQMRKQCTIIAAFYIMMLPSLRIFVLDFCSCYLAHSSLLCECEKKILSHLQAILRCDTVIP